MNFRENPMKKKFTLLAAVLVLLSALPARDGDPWNAMLAKISTIFSIVENGYHADVDPEKMTFSTIRGLLDSLDPHSYFLEPDYFSRMREDYTGKYFGLGIQIQKQDDRLVVVSPIEGTPAWRMGIRPGDVISHIEGEDTKPISSFDAMQKLRGEKGTSVSITIVREGLDEPLELTIVREEIPLHSVPYAFMLDGVTGYVFIRNFAENTTRELEEKLLALTAQGMTRLVLDLRGNGGGPLAQSIEVSDEFLPKGKLIVSMRGRNPNYDKDFHAFRDGQYETLPLVILINSGTASASEIVSGAVMDHDRGLVVGTDSFGKGLVQTVFPLAPNIAVALTVAKYLTPSGRSIQRDFSIIEDYARLKQAPEEEREVMYTSRGRKVLGQGGITPDHMVTSNIQVLTWRMLLGGSFFSYARKFADRQTPLSRNLAFPDPPSVSPSTPSVVTQAVIEEFKGYLETSGFEFDLDAFAEAVPEIRREIEREIISALWGLEEGNRIHQLSDPVVKKALEVMPEAIRFVTEF